MSIAELSALGNNVLVEKDGQGSLVESLIEVSTPQN